MQRVCKAFKSCIDAAPNIYWREIYHKFYPSGLDHLLSLQDAALTLQDASLFVTKEPPAGSKAAELLQREIFSPVLKSDPLPLSKAQIDWKSYCRLHSMNRIDLLAVKAEAAQCAFVKSDLISALHYAPRYGYSSSAALRLFRSEHPLRPVFCEGKIAYFEIVRKQNAGKTVTTFGLVSEYEIHQKL